MVALVRVCAGKMGLFSKPTCCGDRWAIFSFALPVTQDVKEGKGLRLSTLMETLQADPWAAGKGRGRQNIQPQPASLWRNTVWLGRGGDPEGLCVTPEFL